MTEIEIQQEKHNEMIKDFIAKGFAVITKDGQIKVI